jgi:hypothetical protein
MPAGHLTESGETANSRLLGARVNTAVPGIGVVVILACGVSAALGSLAVRYSPEPAAKSTWRCLHSSFNG